jgi:hypothetical membrane protein
MLCVIGRLTATRATVKKGQPTVRRFLREPAGDAFGRPGCRFGEGFRPRRHAPSQAAGVTARRANNFAPWTKYSWMPSITRKFEPKDRCMRHLRRSDCITLGLLGFGVAVPLLYYGVQVVAAPFFSGFSFLSTTASELGSDSSTRPWIFNAGAILVGISALVAAAGFARAFLDLGAHPFLAWLTSIDVAATGLSSLWAGIFPLPDPRHGGHPAMLFAMLLLPFIMATTLWTLGASRLLIGYFVATIGLLLVMLPVMMGTTGLDTHNYQGLLQRIFALTVFPPVGVGAYALGWRILAGIDTNSSSDTLDASELRASNAV